MLQQTGLLEKLLVLVQSSVGTEKDVSAEKEGMRECGIPVFVYSNRRHSSLPRKNRSFQERAQAWQINSTYFRERYPHISIACYRAKKAREM